MAVYTQAELNTIFTNSGLSDPSVIRRLADVVIKSYLSFTPTYNYNTGKYLSQISRTIVEVALASYGQNYTAAQIQTLLLAYPYFCSPGFSAVTTGVLLVQALLAILEQGAESLNETNFATHANWDVTGDFTDSGGNAAYLHAAGAGTLTQTSAHLAVALVGSAWYKLEYTISGVVNAAHITACQITTGILDVALDIPVTVAGKYTVIFKTKAVPGDFVISATDDAATTAFVIDDISLKQITNTLYSASTVHPTLPYVKEYISKAWNEVCRRLNDGIQATYGSFKKLNEPEYDANLND